MGHVQLSKLYLDYSTSSWQQPYGLGTIINHILQLKKVSPSEVQWPVHSCTAGDWWHGV